MTALATPGWGVLLKVDDGGGVNYATIAEVYDIDGPNMTADLIDVMTQDSTNAYEDRIPTVLHAGDITFVCNFLPQNATQGYSGTNGLVKLFDSRLKRSYKLLWTDGAATPWICQGFVNRFYPRGHIKDSLKADVSIALTGRPTFA